MAVSVTCSASVAIVVGMALVAITLVALPLLATSFEAR